MSFDEFLEAIGEKQIIVLKNNATFDNPLDMVFHEKLIDYLKIYYIIGGMPEIVKEYVDTKNILSCQNKLNSLIETLRDDFAKYKKRSPLQRLREIFDSIALQAGGKFKYSNIDSHSSHNALKEALELIVQAGLAYKIYHTSAQGIPLGAQIKVNKFKVVPLDTGIHQNILGLNMADIMTAQNVDVINKGSIAEIFTGLEIIKNSPYSTKANLYYWHKEKRGSSAEVDYLIQCGERIIPIEVKSGIKGKMHSLRLFIKEHNVKKGIRVSLENFHYSDNIDIYPLYAIKNILPSNKNLLSF
jgi:predicted AAA+ superfamily ATPase